jgi:hypothetical protein
MNADERAEAVGLRVAKHVEATAGRVGRGPKGARKDARLPTGYGPRLQRLVPRLHKRLRGARDLVNARPGFVQR